MDTPEEFIQTYGQKYRIENSKHVHHPLNDLQSLLMNLIDSHHTKQA